MSRTDAAADPDFWEPPPALGDWMAAELTPDEKVVWVGRPISLGLDAGRLAPLGGLAVGLLLCTTPRWAAGSSL